MIIREWLDCRLAGTVTAKHCRNCDRDVKMEYIGSYIKDGNDVRREVRDVYKCLADCQAKHKYEMENLGMKWSPPLFSYKRGEK